MCSGHLSWPLTLQAPDELLDPKVVIVVTVIVLPDGMCAQFG